MSSPSARDSFSLAIQNCIRFYSNFRRYLQYAQLVLTGVLVALCAFMEGLADTEKAILMVLIVILVILDLLCAIPGIIDKPSLDWVRTGFDYENELTIARQSLATAESLSEEHKSYSHALTESMRVVSNALILNDLGNSFTPYFVPFWSDSKKRMQLFGIPEDDPFCRLVIYFFTNGDFTLYSPICDLPGPSIKEDPVAWRVREGLTGACAFTKKAIIKADLSTDSTPLDESQRPHYKSGIAVPINIKGDCLGTVTITSSHPNLWAEGSRPNELGLAAKNRAEIIAAIMTVLWIEQAQIRARGTTP